MLTNNDLSDLASLAEFEDLESPLDELIEQLQADLQQEKELNFRLNETIINLRHQIAVLKLPAHE